ncbi:MAG: lipocalin family protein [Sulfurospirillaceae bacterium]|nr:lipocalin family protein [Sulfurospirillaceae bacterium]
MKYIVLMLAYLFSGCSSNYPHLATVDKVDLNRYLGTWYEIARYDHVFERGCVNVSATYSLKKNGKIQVVNRCETSEGKQKEAIGSAYAVDDSNSKLKVTFFWPFYGNYWIIKLDSNYTYALIGDPSRKYLWILSRTKKLDEDVKAKLLSSLPALGYTQDKLIWTPQK